MSEQDYPRHLHKAGRKHIVVKSPEEQEAAVNDGWSLDPIPEDWTAAYWDKNDGPKNDETGPGFTDAGKGKKGKK